MLDLTRETLALMERYGDGKKPLWITEIGCGAGTKESDLEQARLLAEVYAAARKEARIQRVFWFVLRDLEKDVLGPEGSMGLFNFQGKPKPALEAFRRAVEKGSSK